MKAGRLAFLLGAVRGLARGPERIATPEEREDPREYDATPHPGAELAVAVLLVAGGLLCLAFAVLIAAHPQIQLLGGVLAADVGCLGAALALASKRVVPQEVRVEEREPVPPEVDAALEAEARADIESTWAAAGPVPGDPDWAGGDVFVDARETIIPATPSRVFEVLSRLGGRQGWFRYDGLWRLRGRLDRLIGGPGWKRGRRHPDRLSWGEVVDFWRVTELDRDRRLTLRAVWATSRPLSAAVVFLVILGALLPLAFTLSTGVAVNSVAPAIRDGLSSPAGSRLLRAVVAVGVLFAAQQTISIVREAVVDLLGRAFRREMFRRTFAVTLRPATIAHLEDPKYKDMIVKVTEIGAIGPRAAVTGFANQWTMRLGAVGGLALVFRFKVWIGFLLLVLLLHEQRRYRDSYQRLSATLWNQAQQLRRSTYLLSVATTPDPAKEVRVFGLPDWIVGRYRDAWHTAMQRLWTLRRSNWPDALRGTGPVVVAEVVILAMVARAGATKAISIGAVAVYAQALISSLNISGVSDADTYVAEGVQVVRSLLDLEDAIERDDSLRMSGDRAPTDMPATAIRFEGVRFHYPGQQQDVFQGVDLEIPAGHSLAIVGVNGAGKTTLIKLLARLYDPTDGRITVDGVDLREVDPRLWQRRVAAIFQDFIRYQLPASANVGFGAVERLDDRAALVAAARDASVLEVIDALPNGWETTLSRQWDGGADLSGGEWQRVALARALFASKAGAPVLVLDEPTAQLDVRAEAAFYERFLDITRGRTTVVISHRFSTVRRADRIVMLEHGRITEQGTHDELVAQNGRYAAMFRLQADRFANA